MTRPPTWREAMFYTRWHDSGLVLVPLLLALTIIAAVVIVVREFL